MEKLTLYGLIGYPVSHSYSPSMHNAAFKKLGIKAQYRLFEVKPEDLKDFIKAIPGKLSGLNVTIPHKEAVMEFLDVININAKLIGAVNTIVVKDKKLIGENTDSKGFVAAFKLATKTTPKDKKIFMFGAGGGAKAVAFGLSQEGASYLTICDIVEKKAMNLASHINNHTRCKAEGISQRDIRKLSKEVASSDVLVNATPCGMKKTDPKLLDGALLHKGLIVCDLIYNPQKTLLLKDAAKKGLVTMNGIGMLLQQGALSFKLWTGQRPPVEVMKEALKARMSA